MSKTKKKLDEQCGRVVVEQALKTLGREDCEVTASTDGGVCINLPLRGDEVYPEAATISFGRGVEALGIEHITETLRHGLAEVALLVMGRHPDQQESLTVDVAALHGTLQAVRSLEAARALPVVEMSPAYALCESDDASVILAFKDARGQTMRVVTAGGQIFAAQLGA